MEFQTHFWIFFAGSQRIGVMLLLVFHNGTGREHTGVKFHVHERHFNIVDPKGATLWIHTGNLYNENEIV
jgi:hypothetical protein